MSTFRICQSLAVTRPRELAAATEAFLRVLGAPSSFHTVCLIYALHVLSLIVSFIKGSTGEAEIWRLRVVTGSRECGDNQADLSS